VITSLTLRKLSLAPIAALVLAAGLLSAAPANAVVVPTAAFAVTSPAAGEAVASRTVQFAGTGTPAAAVGVTSLDGASLFGVPAIVDATGAWSLTVDFAANAETTQSLLVSQVIDLTTPPTSVPITFTLPSAPVEPVAAIVLTDPGSLEVLTSRTVTFAGSAPAGTEITIASGADIATLESAALAGVGGDIVVTAEGTWSTTLTLAPNAYSFFAGQSQLIGAEGNVAASERSERRDFTLVAQAVAPAAPTVPVNTPAVPVRVPAAPASNVRELAATGVEITGLAGGISALLVALGAAAIVAARRRQLTSEL